MTVSAEELVEALRAAVASPVREYVVIWKRAMNYGYGSKPEIVYFASRVRAYDVRDVIQGWMGRFVPKSQTQPTGNRVGDTSNRLLRVVPFEPTLHGEIPSTGEDWPWKAESEIL